MNKSYRIIEPLNIEPLTRQPENHSLMIALYYWLISEVESELIERSPSVELEVIGGGLLSRFPMLGVHYKLNEEYDRELEKYIEERCDHLLSEKSLTDFIQYVVNSEIDWQDKVDEIMAD